MTLCPSRNAANALASWRMDIAVADYIHSNMLQFSLTRDLKFLKMIDIAKTLGPRYNTPDQRQMSGPLLDTLYKANRTEMMRTLLVDAKPFDVTIQSDGATITNVPLLNVLASSPNNPFALLEIVDCTDQMVKGGMKDVEYLCSVIRPLIQQLEDRGNVRKKGPKPSIVDLVMFDGASIVQLCGRLLTKYHPRITVCHGVEHAVSLFFSDIYTKV
jgi:hypothetical protein